MWVGLTHSVEGLNGTKRLVFPKEEGTFSAFGLQLKHWGFQGLESAHSTCQMSHVSQSL